jgi:WD40 repeat protein
MRDDEIRRALVEPARRSQLTVDDELTETVLDEVRGQPEALPMLSAAMVNTWENREGSRLTLDGYRRGGGVGGAIEASAERIYGELDQSQQDQTRQLLVRLASQEGGSWVRRPMPLAEASTHADSAVLQALAVGRLISLDKSRVQLTHESLLDRWPKLRDWLDDRAIAGELLEHLRGAAQAWNASGRGPYDLYRGARLQAAQDWKDQHPVEVTGVEQDFLTASAEATDRALTEANARAEREAAGRRRLRSVALALAAVVVLALAAAAVAIAERGTARHQQGNAVRSALAADSRKLAAQALSASDLRTSLLLSTAAYRLQDSADSRSGLLATLERNGSALWRVPTENRVQWLGVSPDGKQLWTADNNRSITKFDGTTHQQTGQFPMRASVLAAFSPDNRMIVAVGAAGFHDKAGNTRAIILDAQTGAVLKVLPVAAVAGGTGERTAAFTGDGHWLIVAEGDAATPGTYTNRVAVFDATHLNAPPRTLKLPNPIVGLATGHDAFVVNTDMGELEMVNPVDVSIVGHGNQPSLATPGSAGQDLVPPPIALSPDGKHLAVLRVQRPSLPLLLDTAHLSGTLEPAEDLGTPVNEMTFSPASDLLAAGGSSGTIDLIHASDGSQAARLTGNSGQVMGLGWSGNRTDGELFAGGLDSQVVAYDAHLTSRLVTASGPASGRAGYQTLFGNMILGLRPQEGDGPESKIQLIEEDPQSGDTVRTFPLGLSDSDGVANLAPDSSNRTLLLTIQHSDGTIGCRLFDLATGRRMTDFAPTTAASPHQTFTATLSPDGKTAVASVGDRTLAVIDIATARTVKTVTVNFTGTAADRTLAIPIAFGPDGRLLVSGYDPGPPTLPPPGSSQPTPTSTDNSPQDSRAVTVDLTTGSTSSEVRLGSLGLFNAFDWSPNHRMLAIGTITGRLVEVNATTMTQIGDQVSADPGQLVAVRYSPDGQTIATTGTDGNISLWDAATLRPIGTPIQANSLETWWTPAGDLYGYQSVDGPAPEQRRFTLPGRPEEWSALACHIADSDLTKADWARYVGDRPYRKVCS